MLEPDARLGTYRLVSKLGAGGMGEVWKAEDTRLSRMVAIKILPPSVANDPEYKARFTREARTAAQLAHPNIAMIHSIEEDAERSFIVMELVPGEPLSALIRRGALTEPDVCSIVRKVADALAEAHEKGIIHRDIKPDNVIVDGSKVKVLDFGIAKQIGLQPSTSATTTGFMTQAGVIMGTVHYMSPEQALGKQLDPRSDLFSLGVVMYEALTGQLPFDGETITEVLTRIARDEPRAVRAVNPGISPAVAGIVEKLMEKERDLRFESAAHLSAALERLSAFASTAQIDPMAATMPRTEALSPAQVTAIAHPRRRIGWIVASVAIAAMVLIGVSLGVIVRKQKENAAAPPASLETSVTVQGQAVATNPPPPAQPVSATQTAVATPSTDQAAAPAAQTPPAASTTAPSTAAVIGTGKKTEARAATPAATAPPKTETAQTTAPLQTGQSAAADPARQARQSYEAGIALLSRGNRMAAWVAFREAVDADPHFAPARLKLAESLLFRRDFELAEAELNRTLEDSDRLDERQKSIAGLALAIARHDREAAESLAEKHRARFPNDLELRALLAQFGENGTQPNRSPRRRRP